MSKPVVKVIPAQEALVHFRTACGTEAAFEKARRVTTGDAPKLSENHVEITHTCTIQVPYTMRKLMHNNGSGLWGPLRLVMKDGTAWKHSSLMNEVNPTGYLCEVYVDMGGMTGPCNLLVAVDAINSTNTMVLKTHHKQPGNANIDRLMQISKSGEASQWNAQAVSISSFRDPRTGNLLATDMIKHVQTKPSNATNFDASSSSSSAMDDDEKALHEMQEMVGKMCIVEGIEFTKPKYIFQGKSTLRHTYDVLGAINPKTLDTCAFKIKRSDDHVYVLAHSVVGMAILGSQCTLACSVKEDALPTDELGYVLKVPISVYEKARNSVLNKASQWERAAAHSIEDMHIRVRPAVLSWKLTENGTHFERDGLRVDADEEFTFTARLNFVQRHYNSERCAAILVQFKDVWPQPVFHTKDVNFKTGETRKGAPSLVHLLDQNLERREDQLELLANLSDEKVLAALSEAGVDVDEDGVPVPKASTASSSGTSAVEDD